MYRKLYCWMQVPIALIASFASYHDAFGVYQIGSMASTPFPQLSAFLSEFETLGYVTMIRTSVTLSIRLHNCPIPANHVAEASSLDKSITSSSLLFQKFRYLLSEQNVCYPGVPQPPVRRLRC